MAYVKSMRVVHIKGVDDPFTLTAIVKAAIDRRDLQQFNEEHKALTSYAELVALCGKFVLLDDTKERGSEPEFGEHREIYNDVTVPWRQRVWDTAQFLLNDARVTKSWTVIVAEYHREVTLHLSHKIASGVHSPSVGLEAGKYSNTESTVKIRTYPGLAMNLSLSKATPSKIAMKLIDHAEKALTTIKARQDRDTSALQKREQSKKLVAEIEQVYGIPRYYVGSGNLQIRTDGVELTVEPSEYGNAYLTLKLAISAETKSMPAALGALVDLVKGLKAAADHEKAKQVIDEKRKLKLVQKD